MTDAERIAALAQFTSDELLAEWSRRNDQNLQSWIDELNSDENRRTTDEMLAELAAQSEAALHELAAQNLT